MPPKHLFTNSLPANLQMNKNQDSVDITVDDTCDWCFADPDGVFGNPSTLLASGHYDKTTPPTKYGPYTPVKAGIVHINAVKSGTCDPYGTTHTGHTITVSN